MTSLTLIINTYNQPEYMERVLRAVSAQTSAPEQVLLADDGSDDETRARFASWAAAAARNFQTAHVWQPHEGFRRARVLNRAIAQAQRDYIVFLDGDTVPHPEFLADHRSQARRGSFIQGHRALVRQDASRWFGTGEFRTERRRALWRGQIHGVKHAFRWPVPFRRALSGLRGIRGCNLAIWREDLVLVNGYNEKFVGWGREDSELAARLLNAGRTRLDLRGRALCFHLWHPPASKQNLAANDELLAKALAERAQRCDTGLDQYLPEGSRGIPAARGGIAPSEPS